MLILYQCLLLNFYFTFAIRLVPPEKQEQHLQVSTTNGVIQGILEKNIFGKTYASYLGIPYARPPINELRFRAPKPINKWSGVLNATVEGSCCAGLNVTSLVTFEFNSVGEEDCLYLNVFTPKTSTSDKKNLPVVMWIYGGAFFGGCGTKTLFGPDYFIEHDVILVVPNYRVSAFGYLSTEDLECPGNWASKDQILALKWIQMNIRNFGGDYRRVTIFGQSAGAASVNVLVVSPKAKGLFHRAIMISGSTLSFWAYQAHQRKIAFDVGVALGIEANSTKELIQELRKVDGDLLAQKQIPAILVNFLSIVTDGLPFTPTVEPKHKEAVLTDFTYNLLEKGDFNKVPVLVGTTNLEMLLFKRAVEFAKPFMLLYDISPGSIVRMTADIANRTLVGNKIKKYFLGEKSFTEASEEALLKVLSEEGYWRPLHKISTLIAKYCPVYFYEFAYEGDVGMALNKQFTGSSKRSFKGVSHTEDIAYLFKPDFEKTRNAQDQKITKKIVKFYMNFIKTGNPTPIKNPELGNITWPLVTENKVPFIRINDPLEEVDEDFHKDAFRFWESCFNDYAQKPYKVY